MKYAIKTQDEIEAWHPWFAWYPVRVGDRMVHLEWVERRTPFCRLVGFEGPLPTEYRQ